MFVERLNKMTNFSSSECVKFMTDLFIELKLKITQEENFNNIQVEEGYCVVGNIRITHSYTQDWIQIQLLPKETMTFPRIYRVKDICRNNYKSEGIWCCVFINLNKGKTDLVKIKTLLNKIYELIPNISIFYDENQELDMNIKGSFEYPENSYVKKTTENNIFTPINKYLKEEVYG